MDNYLKSTDVNVYPTGFRGVTNDNKTYDPESMLNTEDNITRPYRLLSTASFVITETYTKGEGFEFVINGYYFKLKNFTAPEGEKIYAHICVKPKGNTEDTDTTNTTYIANSLSPIGAQNTDDLDGTSNQFIGLVIDENEKKENCINFLILENNKIPEKSRLKYSNEYVIGGVDYTTKENTALKNQLDTSLVYNPSVYSNLIVQGKTGVTVKQANGEENPGSYINLTDKNIKANASNIEIGSSDNHNIKLAYVENNNIITLKNATDVVGLNYGISLESKNKIVSQTSNDNKLEIKTNNPNSESVEIKTPELKIDTPSLKVTQGSDSTPASISFKDVSTKHTLDLDGFTEVTLESEEIETDTTTYKIGVKKSYTLNMPGTNSNSSIKIDADEGELILSNLKDGYGSKFLLTSDTMTLSKNSSNTAGTSIILNDTSLSPASNKGTNLGGDSNYFNKAYIDNIKANTVNVNNTINVGTGIVLSSTENSIKANYFVATSDERLKENIKPFVYDKSITDVEVKEFNYKDSDKKTIGILAQDLQKFYPELVEKDSKGFLSIQETKLVYLLLEEVKQLKQEIQFIKKLK